MACATPWLPLAPMPAGHLTALATPTVDFHSLDTLPRWSVKWYEVPLLSDRWTTWMALLGSVTPEFCAVIAASFHFVMWPKKMLASVGPSSCSLLPPDRS